MASNNFAAQPTRGFSDRLQTYWDHPDPQGLVAMLKAALNGIGEAVQGSIAATSTPSTEQEAFWQNQGRDRGPVGALQAATLLTPLAPGVAGGRLAAPLLDALRSRSSSLAAGADILQKGAAVASTGIRSAKTQASVPYINEFLRYLNPSDRVATHPTATDTANPTIRFVSRNTNHLSNAGSATARESGVPTRTEIALQKPVLTPPANRFVSGGGTAERISTRIAPTGLVDTKRPVVPDKPVALPPPLAGEQTTGNSPPKPPGNSSIGTGGDDEDCKKERSTAHRICVEAFAEGWKSDFDVGPKKKEFGGRWTIPDCVQGLVSQRCAGNRHDDRSRKPYFKKKRGRKGK